VRLVAERNYRLSLAFVLAGVIILYIY